MLFKSILPTILALLVVMISGCGEGTGRDTTANKTPVAVIKKYHTPYLKGDVLVLDASSSYDSDGIISRYEWDIDGTTISNDQKIYLPSIKPGRHIITLKVWDNNYARDFKKEALNIPDICSSIDLEKDKIYSIMKSDYLWYEHIPSSKPQNTVTLGEFLDKLKYKEYDKWSFILSKESYKNIFENGKYIGIGVSLIAKYDNDKTKIYVRYINNNSPASRTSLKRGDEILKINDKTIDEIYDEGLWGTIFGEDKIGVKVTFNIRRDDGSTDKLEIKKDAFVIETVQNRKIIDTADGSKVGYLNFLQFIQPSKEELVESFAEFKEKNIDELVLDLRYNGGGRLDVANLLASLIGGLSVDKDEFISLKFNDKNSKYDEIYNFKANRSLDLNLKRVFVLTGHPTCSASEAVINGLKPYMDVILIGDTTCGKPVGMAPYNICDYVLFAINFSLYNVQNEGEYFNGINSKCYAADDLSYQLGDIKEPLLKEALYYIDNEKCSNTSSNKIINNHRIDNYTNKLYQGIKREIGLF